MNHAYIRLLIFLYTADHSSVDVSIAKVLLAHIDEFPDILIEDIAHQAMTTPASVTKFAHKLQYQSFKELRMDIHEESTNQQIQRQLLVAKDDCEKACDLYCLEASQRMSQYRKLYDSQMIQRTAEVLTHCKEISVIYAPYAYPCVHVLRNYMEPFSIQVQGLVRHLDEAFMKERILHSQMIIIISLQGDWIREHHHQLLQYQRMGKKLMLVTSIYDETFQELSEFIFPFQFMGDTILDTATQISTLFAKLAFALSNFPKLEKT